MRLSRAVLRERWPGWVGQAVLLAVVAWLAWTGVANFAGNLQRLHIGSGFGFLHAHAGFQLVDEVAFALPFSFQPDDYVQILTDLAERLGPALGWSPAA